MQGDSDDEGVSRPMVEADRSGLPGLELACEALADGQAVVVPNPPPMTYGVVATSAQAVNALKRRPLGQDVAVSVHDQSQWEGVASAIDLPRAALEAVGALLRSRITVLVPLHRSEPYPPWIDPAVRDDELAVFDGHWAPTARLWEQFPRLYGSSANITGEQPAENAEHASATFGASCPIVDADAMAGHPGRRWASTMVRIDRTGRLELYRSGAHDASCELASAGYVRRLAASVGLPVDGGDGPVGAGDSGIQS